MVLEKKSAPFGRYNGPFWKNPLSRLPFSPTQFFLSSGSQFRLPKWRWLLRLERRNELEEMAPIMAIYLESTSFIASSHEGKAHLSILTTPRSLRHVRSADDRF